MLQYFKEIIGWIFVIALIGSLSGVSSGFFLISLAWVTQIRVENSMLILLLPLGGFAIGWLYHKFGTEVVKGNNQILEEHQYPQKIIPFKMAPLVLIGTLITHLFGGSAGREGTAVQMSAAISDQFSNRFKFLKIHRKTLLAMGIAAGFASVFGTPWAGVVFAFEITRFKWKDWKTIIPVFFVAFVAHFICKALPVAHTHYPIIESPDLSLLLFVFCLLIGIFFGLASAVFSRTTHFWQQISQRWIQYLPLRPFFGGLILAIIFLTTASENYQGLGIPTILASFEKQQLWFVFLLKILFTSFTLGTGFKGGEVTPLFFIGATLGSALSIFVPAPIAFLAALGFVAVFAGATHAPIASAIMGMELFGPSIGFWLLFVCYIAYFTSGTKGIYRSQELNVGKKWLYGKLKWF